MIEEQIVKKLCEIMGVKYSHYDNHKMSKDYFTHQKLESIPKIVVYSGMSPWQFAVLEDMSVITSMSSFHKTFMEMKEILQKLDDNQNELLSTISDEMLRIEKAEQYLKDNNCSVVINDKLKSINNL